MTFYWLLDRWLYNHGIEADLRLRYLQKIEGSGSRPKDG